MTPTMTINGVEYVEAKPQKTGPDWDDVCSQCALDPREFRGDIDDSPCYRAYESSRVAFGGDCIERRVIYIRKESPAAP